MRILFMGTPEFAVPTLAALIAGEDSLVGVVCQPDRPAGRGQKLHEPPVKVLARKSGLPVLQPDKLRSADTVDALRWLDAELVVVAAYGKILPPALLQLPPHGCINVHASLLPKYRGAAPIQWAILCGETTTGVTIMQMNEGMDAGDILLQRPMEIGGEETFGELQERLARLGAEALVAALTELQKGALRARPQDESAATLAPRIQKNDGRIDWSGAATQLARQVRAFNPWPSAFTSLRGQQLKIHRAAVVIAPAAPPGTVVAVGGDPIVVCGEGALELQEVQIEGRQRLPGAVFARGARLEPGSRLG